jgi:hypothetical protein
VELPVEAKKSFETLVEDFGVRSVVVHQTALVNLRRNHFHDYLLKMHCRTG